MCLTAVACGAGRHNRVLNHLAFHHPTRRKASPKPIMPLDAERGDREAYRASGFLIACRDSDLRSKQLHLKKFGEERVLGADLVRRQALDLVGKDDPFRPDVLRVVIGLD